MLYHLRTKFDLDSVTAVGNTLLQEYTLSVLPDQVEVVADPHLRPCYGDEDDTEGLYHSEAKAVTTAFHAYATPYARMRNKPATRTFLIASEFTSIKTVVFIDCKE